MRLTDAPIYSYHPRAADAACQVDVLRRYGLAGIVATEQTPAPALPPRAVWLVVVPGQPLHLYLSAQEAGYALLARLVVGGCRAGRTG